MLRTSSGGLGGAARRVFREEAGLRGADLRLRAGLPRGMRQS
jgi:hypothetical protein